MTDIRLDSDGDLAISNGDLVVIGDTEEIRQHLQVRLGFFRGEWFLDRGIGVPYFERVLAQELDRSALNSVFRSAILDTPGVKAIESLDFDVDSTTRLLTVTFVAVTDDGERIESQQEVSL